MKLTKRQIQQIKRAWAEAERKEQASQLAQRALGQLITKITGVKGHADHLTRDGMGFTPEVNNDTHIYLGDLVELAEGGQDITEELILHNLTL